MAINWESKYCERANGIYGSMTRQLMHLIANPEVISFGGGLPASELFPVDQVKAITHDVLDQKGMAVLQYGTSEGYEPLRQAVVERYNQRGFGIGLENVLITSGAQQGIDLVSKLFVGKGDLIVVGDPTFLTALQTFNLFQADYLTVPVDAEGMQVERLPGILEARNVKFIYIMPNFQNPSGATLSLERRRQVMEIVRYYQVPVVEDDAYGELRYDGEHLPALKSMDPDGQVIYLGSFSKVLSPGIRVSALIAEKNLMEKLVFAKQAADLHTDNLAQHIIYEFMRRDWLDGHIARLIDFYRKRRDAMIQAMTTYLPAKVTWTTPKAGFFCGPRCPQASIPASFSKKRWKPRSLMCRAPATTPKAAASAACG
ncbi:aminotransferase, class I/II [Desulfosarcina variabilis str. Montpellier]|uniref:aminotransferase-like domain-containing protein n=1 Tax=Desulfosarcina variabilis TaxID=2300 RepID=UPI003AFB5390